MATLKGNSRIENALLRRQLVVLRRSVKRPVLTPTDRTLLVLLAGCTRAWRRALLIIKPDTLLGWHCHVNESREGQEGASACSPALTAHFR